MLSSLQAPLNWWGGGESGVYGFQGFGTWLPSPAPNRICPSVQPPRDTRTRGPCTHICLHLGWVAWPWVSPKAVFLSCPRIPLSVQSVCAPWSGPVQLSCLCSHPVARVSIHYPPLSTPVCPSITPTPAHPCLAFNPSECPAPVQWICAPHPPTPIPVCPVHLPPWGCLCVWPHPPAPPHLSHLSAPRSIGGP